MRLSRPAEINWGFELERTSWDQMYLKIRILRPKEELRRTLNFDSDYVVWLGLLSLCSLGIGLVGILIASVEKVLVTLPIANPCSTTHSNYWIT